MKLHWRLMLVALLFALLCVGLVASEVHRRWQTPLTVPEAGVVFIVTAGDSLRTVVSNLHTRGVVSHPKPLLWYGRYSGLDQQIKVGEYRIAPGATALSLLHLLSSGAVVRYQVTLPEGITLSRALEIFAQTPQINAELSGLQDPRLLQLIAPRVQPEGLFFPDSYQFERGTTDLQLLRRAYQRLQATLVAEWAGRAPELPYESPYEALIMASIIERETGIAAERATIAGVFVRRLQKGIRLQTDPTVIYGLGAGFDGNLLRRHLNDAGNPYNTYRHRGLPPTPIALPGRAAIRAALHPAAGSDLYFVARGDGSHQFSSTLAEHQQAVRKYQWQRRSDYRSSPAGKK